MTVQLTVSLAFTTIRSTSWSEVYVFSYVAAMSSYSLQKMSWGFHMSVSNIPNQKKVIECYEMLQNV